MVNSNIVITQISNTNSYLIKNFLDSAGESLKSFRYYNTRSLEIIKEHLITAVLENNNQIVGYGHLDKENNKVWLGIAICEAETGKGLGKLMMLYLTQKADEMKIKSVYLSVDKSNLLAIELYKKFGFSLFKDTSDSTQLMIRKYC